MRDRRTPIIAAAGVAVVLLLTLFFLVLPKMSEVSSANDQLDQAVSQQATLESQLAALQQAQQDAPEAREEIRQADQAIPPTADQQGFILLLQNAADQAGVDLFTITPSTPTFDPATGLSQIATTLTVNGSYFAITEFLFNVETLPRAAKVTTLALAPGGDGTTGGLGATANLFFYTTDESAGPGSVPGPTAGVDAGTTPPVSPSPSPAAELQPEGN